jgi:NifU-like protein involved in Fe-S cluster formation
MNDAMSQFTASHVHPLAISAPSYSPLVEEHFHAPRNAGSLAPAPDVIAASAGSEEQGVRFVLTARVGNGRILELRQRVYGCPHSIAAASWLTERLEGATRDDLTRWRWREVADALAVPTEKRGRLLLLEDAVRGLADAWERLSHSKG